ncbi:MAG: AAA family ATPase [Anaerolineae bacterium]
MRIAGIYIDGFGIYHNHEVPDVQPGLIVFAGSNESGKSTFLEFIRSMLFGFPAARRGRNSYPPLRGGRFGGRLLITTRDGQHYSIERDARQVTTTREDGWTSPAEPAEALLGGMDRDTFERVFAIGLDDLHGLGVLSEEGVKERLLAASAGLGIASVPGALGWLEASLANVLQPRGRRQLLPRALAELHRAEEVVDGARGEAAEYAAGTRRLAELRQSVAAARQEQAGLRTQLRRVEQLLEAREPWLRLTAARERTSTYEFARAFPPDALSRYENLTREVEELARGAEALGEDTARDEVHLQESHVDDTVLAQEARIDALRSEREKLATALSDSPAALDEANRAEAYYRRNLADLGADWSAEKLRAADTSVQVRQRVMEFRRQIGGAERRAEEATERQRTRAEEVEEAADQAMEAQRRLDELPQPAIGDLETLQRRQDVVRRLRSPLHRKEVASTQLQSRQAALQEASRRLGLLEQQVDLGAQPLPGWILLVAFGAVLPLLAVIVAIQWMPAAGISLGLLDVLLAAGFYTLRRRQTRANAVRQGQFQAQMMQVKNTQRTLSDETDTLETQLRDTAAEVVALSAEGGIDVPADTAQLEALASRLDGIAELWRERNTAERGRRTADSRLQAVQARLARATQEADDASRVLQRLNDDWRDWLSIRGYTSSVGPDEFETFLAGIDSTRAAEQEWLTAHQRHERLEAYVADTRRRIGSLLADTGRRPQGEEAGTEDLDALQRALEGAREVLRQRRELHERLERARAELPRRQHALAEKATAPAALIAAVGAADEEEFRRLAAANAEWRAAASTVDECRRLLGTIAGDGSVLEALQGDLASSQPLQLESERDRLAAHLQQLTESAAEAERESGALQERLRQAAADDRLGGALLDKAVAAAQVSEGVKRWASLALCRHLVLQAQEVYERERQPKVIERASDYLSVMTGGRYRIVTPVDEGDLQISDASQLRKGEVTWSAGLADQVYLAVRLGLAREFGRHGEPLPVVLDDVMVKFDPRRQLGAAKVMLGLAREQQVLLLSCDPGIGRVIERARQELQDGADVSYYTVADGSIARVAGPQEVLEAIGASAG